MKKGTNSFCFFFPKNTIAFAYLVLYNNCIKILEQEKQDLLSITTRVFNTPPAYISKNWKDKIDNISKEGETTNVIGIRKLGSFQCYM